MKAILTLAALAACTQALVSGNVGCCFHLTAFGGPGGPLGQLSDGQNRIGQSGLPTGQYCVDGNGGLTDSNGRGCILTPPTTQWQCDEGATSTPGFTVGCNGALTYQGRDTFWSCPTGDNGGYNIYSEPIEGEPGCVEIWLNADGCKSECPVKTSTVTAPCPSSTAPPPPKDTCPGELTGSWEFPHLIIPINSADANRAYGTSFNGTASGSTSSIFNFDIPQSAAGKSCTLKFLFPEQSMLETSAYTISGGDQFKFAILDDVATQSTTYASSPKVRYSFGTFTLHPGTAITVGTNPGHCPAGEAVSFWMSPVSDSSLNYFQDSNPCPIGAYITIS